MSVSQAQLTSYLDQFLQAKQFQDYCPNGLQVSGKKQISKVITGVTACQELIDKAIALKADAVLVHHGLFWKGDDPCIHSLKKNRLKALLAHDVNVYAYHLPLDCHDVLGNNVLFAKAVGLQVRGELPTGMQPSCALLGTFEQPQTVDSVSQTLTDVLDRQPLVVGRSDKTINTVGWCTGAGQDFIQQAANAGADAFISGEISERTTHLARENNMTYFAAGHHATERFGIKALGEHLAEQLGLDVQYVEVGNPV